MLDSDEAVGPASRGRTSRDSELIPLALVATTMFFPSRFVIGGPLRSVGAPSVIVGLLALVLHAFGRIITKRSDARRNPVIAALWTFFIATLLAYVVARTRPLDSATSASADRTLALSLSLLGSALCLANLRRSTSIISVLVVLVSLGYFSAALGIIQFVTGFDPATLFRVPGLVLNLDLFEVTRADYRRANGTALHPIEFAVVCSALLPLSTFLLKNAKGWVKNAHALGAATLVIGGVMSVSRSAIIGLLTGIIVLALRWRLRFQLVLLLSIATAADGLYLLAPHLSSILLRLADGVSSDNSIAGRTSDYATVGRVFSAHPFFGTGLGTERGSASLVLDNQYLGSLIDGGAVLVLCLVILLIISLSAANLLTRIGKSQITRDLALALVASLTVLALSAAFFDEFSFRQVTTVHFLLIGVTAALFDFNKSERSRSYEPARVSWE